ncbi:MAG: hypothetical protein M5U25_01980 [Planctomycetota bacterium]|nr:hypothetical protein [Planctomycetota bacterium]
MNNLFTTDHVDLTDTRPLEDLTDVELAQAIREGRPGAMTEECLRIYARKLGITDRRRVTPDWMLRQPASGAVREPRTSRGSRTHN